MPDELGLAIFGARFEDRRHRGKLGLAGVCGPLCTPTSKSSSCRQRTSYTRDATKPKIISSVARRMRMQMIAVTPEGGREILLSLAHIVSIETSDETCTLLLSGGRSIRLNERMESFAARAGINLI
jgi:hypothetical protein